MCRSSIGFLLSFTITTLFLPFMLLGCASSSGSLNIAKLEHAQLEQLLIVGKTTQEEVWEQFGAPSEEQAYRGESIWIYNFASSQEGSIGRQLLPAATFGGVIGASIGAVIPFGSAIGSAIRSSLGSGVVGSVASGAITGATIGAGSAASVVAGRASADAVNEALKEDIQDKSNLKSLTIRFDSKGVVKKYFPL